MTRPNDIDALRSAILEGPAYRLAHEDREFLADADLRPLRLQMELLKPERELRRQGIRSTVVVFGSARIPAPEDGTAEPHASRAAQAVGPPNRKAGVGAGRLADQSRLYEEAQLFARNISALFQVEGRKDFVVITGGGPGIMEAANRGAFEVGARSIGLNITLPHEQAPNPFISPELAFRFRYFAIRKMHFLLRARALVAFPGGYGTMDELFEVLTLVQTGKMAPIPIVLVGTDFWRRAINFDFLVEEGFISPRDIQLFTCVDRAHEIIAELEAFYPDGPSSSIVE